MYRFLLKTKYFDIQSFRYLKRYDVSKEGLAYRLKTHNKDFNHDQLCARYHRNDILNIKQGFYTNIFKGCCQGKNIQQIKIVYDRHLGNDNQLLRNADIFELKQTFNNYLKHYVHLSPISSFKYRLANFCRKQKQNFSWSMFDVTEDYIALCEDMDLIFLKYYRYTMKGSTTDWINHLNKLYENEKYILIRATEKFKLYYQPSFTFITPIGWYVNMRKISLKTLKYFVVNKYQFQIIGSHHPKYIQNYFKKNHSN